MEAQKDFSDLLALFNAHRVDYLVVGAHALAFHGAPRYTGDIDVLVQPSQANAKSVLSALDEFGFGSLGLVVEDFATPGKVIQLGVAPVRVDVMTSLTGVSWEEAAAGGVAGVYGDVDVRYLGKREFIANKRVIGRAKDLADVEALGG